MVTARRWLRALFPLLLWGSVPIRPALPQIRPAEMAGRQGFLLKGDTALRQGDLDGAEKAFQQALAAHPDAVGAYANLGVVYMRRRRWAEALTMLRKAEELAPKWQAFS